MDPEVTDPEGIKRTCRMCWICNRSYIRMCCLELTKAKVNEHVQDSVVEMKVKMLNRNPKLGEVEWPSTTRAVYFDHDEPGVEGEVAERDKVIDGEPEKTSMINQNHYCILTLGGRSRH